MPVTLDSKLGYLDDLIPLIPLEEVFEWGLSKAIYKHPIDIFALLKACSHKFQVIHKLS
jgi:hypothetical protein